MKVYRPIIKDKIDKILTSHQYIFCGINFSIYGIDEIRVYDNQDDLNLIYKDTLNNIYQTMPKDLLNNEYNVETLEKFENHQFAICFYLKRKKEKVEVPINAGMKLI